MNPFVLFASSNETDRRALIIGIVMIIVIVPAMSALG